MTISTFIRLGMFLSGSFVALGHPMAPSLAHTAPSERKVISKGYDIREQQIFESAIGSADSWPSVIVADVEDSDTVGKWIAYHQSAKRRNNIMDVDEALAELEQIKEMDEESAYFSEPKQKEEDDGSSMNSAARSGFSDQGISIGYASSRITDDSHTSLLSSTTLPHKTAKQELSTETRMKLASFGMCDNPIVKGNYKIDKCVMKVQQRTVTLTVACESIDTIPRGTLLKYDKTKKKYIIDKEMEQVKRVRQSAYWVGVPANERSSSDNRAVWVESLKKWLSTGLYGHENAEGMEIIPTYCNGWQPAHRFYEFEFFQQNVLPEGYISKKHHVIRKRKQWLAYDHPSIRSGTPVSFHAESGRFLPI